MQSNPLLQVQVTLTAREAQGALGLIRLLLHAELVQHHPKRAYTLVLNPPKGTTSNVFWAEKVYKYCLERSIPALIVRPAQNAQEIAS